MLLSHAVTSDIHALAPLCVLMMLVTPGTLPPCCVRLAKEGRGLFSLTQFQALKREWHSVSPPASVINCKTQNSFLSIHEVSPVIERSRTSNQAHAHWRQQGPLPQGVCAGRCSATMATVMGSTPFQRSHHSRRCRRDRYAGRSN